jgi:hypothetical protein
MDDLLVIILTLIIAGVGALAQLKKKKQAAGNLEQPKQSDNFWGLLDGETESMNQPEVEYVDKPEIEPVVVEDIPLHQFKAKSKKQITAANNLAKEIKKPKLKTKLKEDFSLRKAVIYSEILNRKYT